MSIKENQSTRIYKAIDDLNGEVKEVRKELADVKLELTKYKGYVGGVVFAVSCLSAFVTTIVHMFKTGKLP